MAVDPSIEKPDVAPGPPAEAGKPDQQIDPGKIDDPNLGIDPKYWLQCLDDAERAEADWRKRGREIIQIYRNDSGNQTTQNAKGKSKGFGGRVTFNILFANTETMLPAIYTKPPEPVVKSRFTTPGHPFAPPALPGGPPALPGMLGPPPPAPMPPPSATGPAPVPPSPLPEGGPPGIGGGAGLPAAPPPVPQMQMPPPPSKTPTQRAIDTAASVIEKALEIVVEDEMSHESVKAAIKDVLLPGRGTVRVRWVPHMEQRPVMAGDGETPLPTPPQMGDNGGPPMEDVKVWEQVNDEYVYWEDLLMDPVRAPGDTDWIAFRHLFTAKQAIAEFQGSSPKFDQLIAQGKLESELCLWTEESAAKNLVGGGQPMKSAGKLGDVIRKMMVWEIWDRPNRRILWFIRELGGMALRVDEDTYQLEGFYPIPRPMLAITTTDTQIPRAFYDLYADLAADLDETSRRISNLTKQVKVRGAYNSASNDIANILAADDQKMLPVDGVDMINGGLQNHLWLVPILDFVNALKELYVAREQIKQAIYEIMGISDIMRGATKASETATAQRIKGSMGMVRLSDQKQQASNFVTDLLRMKAELISKNFDQSTLEAMTGETITPEVMAILRSDFMRTCTVDIESDSTVVADEQEEQQSMMMAMQSIQGVMQGMTGVLQLGLFQPPQVAQIALALMKILMHPIRNSRAFIQLLDDMSDQLGQQMMMQAMQPPAPPMPPPPPGSDPSQDPGGPPKPQAAPKPNGAKPPVSGLPVGPGAINV